MELKPDADNAQALLDATLREVGRSRHARSVVLGSLSPDLVRAAREAAPDAQLALFANAALPGTSRRTDFDMLGLNHLQVDAAAVAAPGNAARPRLSVACTLLLGTDAAPGREAVLTALDRDGLCRGNRRTWGRPAALRAAAAIA